MKIIETSLSKDFLASKEGVKLIVQMTTGTNLSVKNCKDQEFSVKDYVIYEDKDNKGKEITLIAMICEDKDTGVEFMLTSSSETVMKKFKQFLDATSQVKDWGNIDIKVISGTSSNDRTYYDIEMM